MLQWEERNTSQTGFLHHPLFIFIFLSLSFALLAVLYASPLSFHLWPCLLKTYTWSWVILCISPHTSCLSSAKSWKRADRLNERGERTAAESLTLLQKCTQPVKQGWCWQIPVWLSLSLLHRSIGKKHRFLHLFWLVPSSFELKPSKQGIVPSISLRKLLGSTCKWKVQAIYHIIAFPSSVCGHSEEPHSSQISVQVSAHSPPVTGEFPISSELHVLLLYPSQLPTWWNTFLTSVSLAMPKCPPFYTIGNGPKVNSHMLKKSECMLTCFPDWLN